MSTNQNVSTTGLIKVIGVGGCGCNIVNAIAPQMQGFEFFRMNSGNEDLKKNRTSKLIPLELQSPASGGNPDRVRRIAELADQNIRAHITGAHLIFVIAGMGGATGTGASSVVARIAKSLNIQAIGIVVLPFEFESANRQRYAMSGIVELETSLDKLIVMPNQALLELGDNVSQETAFSHINNQIRDSIAALSGLHPRPLNISTSC